MLTVDRFVYCFRSLRCSDIAPHVSTYLYINQLVRALRAPGDHQSIKALRIPEIKALLAFTSTGSIPLLVNHLTTGCLLCTLVVCWSVFFSFFLLTMALLVYILHMLFRNFYYVINL